jgi:hypothetical protein
MQPSAGACPTLCVVALKEERDIYFDADLSIYPLQNLQCLAELLKIIQQIPNMRPRLLHVIRGQTPFLGLEVLQAGYVAGFQRMFEREELYIRHPNHCRLFDRVRIHLSPQKD